MTEDEYLKSRLDDQIDWYDKKSTWNQRLFKHLQVTVIVASAIIPFLSGYVTDDLAYLKLGIGGLGLVVAVITAILSLYKFQENWTQYRAICESLRHEKFLYLTKSPPYAGGKSFPLLVQRVESLISRENSDWVRQMTNKATETETT